MMPSPEFVLGVVEQDGTLPENFSFVFSNMISHRASSVCLYGIFDNLVYIIYSQLTGYTFLATANGVEARTLFCGCLFGRFSQSYFL